jgi:small basic protein (TIGR04137 family)
MSLDRSLKTKGSLARHRNVLTRAERIKVLLDQERFEQGDSPYGLPKVAHRKVPVGGKVKKAPHKEGEEAAGTAGTAETGTAGTE